MRDKKFEINWYPFNDGDAMARHMERMHGRGWHLEKFSNFGWTYRRGEPERVHYAVTYFPAASVYDAGPTEGQMTYTEYCEAAGWEFVSAYGPIQFFRSREEDPIPIETDEGEKLRAVHRSMLKTQVLSYALLTFAILLTLGRRLESLSRSVLFHVRDGAFLWMTGLLAFLLAFLLVMLGDYFLWYFRSRWSVARGGACAKSHWRLHLYGVYGMLAAAAVCLAGCFVSTAGTPGGGVWGILLTLLFACGMIAGELGLMALAKRGGWGRGATRALCILAAIVLALVYTGALTLFLSPIMDAHRKDGHVTESYLAYMIPGVGRPEITLYRDELPLTLEDLGVELPQTPVDLRVGLRDRIPYSYRADTERSLLAWGGTYQEVAALLPAEADPPPEFRYDVTVFRWTWVRDWCLDVLGDWYEGKDFGYVPTDASLWRAERGYVRGDSEYFLVYPDRVIYLRLENVELSEEQIPVVVEKLVNAG